MPCKFYWIYALINNGNRTLSRPILSVIIRLIYKIVPPESDFLITSMTTYRIGRSKGLLSINDNRYNFREEVNVNSKH